MKEKSIIWDFDGTIYDTYPRIIDSFHQVINEKYTLGYSKRELQNMILIDTKQMGTCTKTQTSTLSIMHNLRIF